MRSVEKSWIGYLMAVAGVIAFVGQLRKKIEPMPSTPRYILTEPWVGYRFNPNS